MRKIRVGMDISQIVHQGGVASYTGNLAHELNLKKDLDMVFFFSSLRKKYKGGLRNVKSYRLPPSIFEIFFNKIRNVSIEKFIGMVDIFHSSDWIQPPTNAIKVTTYHDVVPIKFPQWSHPSIVSVHKRRLNLVEKEIDIVIAVSNTTKNDLMEVSNIPSEKIRVIYEGPTKKFVKQDEENIKKFKQKYNLPDNFVLAIGGVGERKNLSRIKEAAKGKNLVITGVDIPWVDTEELDLLYQSADVLIYCSLYEGFGLPLVDAFYCGLPVITSNVSSMKEIAGDGALLVNPLGVEEIRKNLDLLLKDKQLRSDLIRKGTARSKEFSWEKCAQETEDVYKKLVNVL